MSELGETVLSETDSELANKDENVNSKSNYVNLNTTLDPEVASLAEPSYLDASNNVFAYSEKPNASGLDAPFNVNESNLKIQSKEELSTESDSNSFGGVDIPQNNGPVFNSPMDGSDIKNVTHNNSSELSLLISALEEQQKRTVTALHTDNSEYSKKLDAIFNPDEPKSELVPEMENLSTSELFNQKFRNVGSVIDSKLDIVLDVEQYLDELSSSAIKLTSGGERETAVSNVSKSIEGISSIVADLTSTKRSSSDLKSALSKLPSFDEDGNIVNANSSNDGNINSDNIVNDNSNTDRAFADLSGAEVINHKQVASDSTAGNEANKYSAPNNTADIKPDSLSTESDVGSIAGNASAQVSVNNEYSDNKASDDVPFELTPQKEELSIDEAFAKAQKEALAQLEQDKELEKQLKEDAQKLNQAFRDSSVNIEKVINPEETASNNSDANDLIGNEDSHYIQNVDITDESCIEVESTVSVNNSDTCESKNSVLPLEVSDTDKFEADNGQVLAQNSSSESDNTEKSTVTDSVAEDKHTDSNLNGNQGTSVTYVAGFFEGKHKEVVQIIPSKLEELNSVLSLLENSKSDALLSAKESGSLKTDSDLLPKSLYKAVKASLKGVFGQNVNTAAAGLETGLNNNALSSDVNASRVSVLAPSALNESVVSSASESVYGLQNDSGTSGDESYPQTHVEVITTVDDDDSDDDSHIETVKVSDLKAVDNVKTQDNESNLADGNPKILRESTLKLIEAEQQFENRRLGRKLEPRDFYYKVEQTDPWFQTILKSGYNDGPVFSALCYSKRNIDPNDEYHWKLQISNDFELMTLAPDFHHNLRTRFSFVLKHPVEIELESYRGIPPGCPEELARMWFVREIENAKKEIYENEDLNNLLMKLGEDISTLNISIYTQKSLENK